MNKIYYVYLHSYVWESLHLEPLGVKLDWHLRTNESETSSNWSSSTSFHQSMGWNDDLDLALVKWHENWWSQLRWEWRDSRYVAPGLWENDESSHFIIHTTRWPGEDSWTEFVITARSAVLSYHTVHAPWGKPILAAKTDSFCPQGWGLLDEYNDVQT